ncbi:MAG TPA: NYN domain-containing protein [Bacteroidota bacterium]|nr:NYN domain-containing protein [Bacteroidota bacterium]
MLPHYIIDGYNVIHAIPSLKKLLTRDAVLAREELIGHVAGLTHRKKFRGTIVFDGQKPPAEFASARAPIHVVYAAPLSADEKIKQLIEHAPNRAWLVVISSDHEILNFARVCACTTHTSKYFARMLFETDTGGEEKSDSAGGLSKSQVDEWLRLFGEL